MCVWWKLYHETARKGALKKMGCLIWMNSKQLHLVAREENEPKNTEFAWKNRNDVEQQQVQQSKGEEMKRTKKSRMSGNDRDKACKDETFTVKRCLWRKITINLVKSWSENTPALPDCITFLLIFFSLSLSESSALSKSSPDFQLLSLVVVPDKQNLLDQADFTAAPAHMAASVAHFLSWGFFFFPPLHTLSFMFKIHFSPNSHSVFTPNNTSSLIIIIFQTLCTLKEPEEDTGIY